MKVVLLGAIIAFTLAYGLLWTIQGTIACARSPHADDGRLRLGCFIVAAVIVGLLGR